MDTMTQRKIRGFAKSNGFTGNESELFERYVAYLYLNRYVSSDVRIIDDIVVGGGTDGGVDIAAVIINGTIVIDASDVADLLNDGSDNSVAATFIQAKTGEKYDTKLISKFLHGVEAVTEYAALGRGRSNLPAGLAQTALILDAVLDNITRFNTTRIPAELYYVTTSKTSTTVERLGETQIDSALKRLNGHSIYPDLLTCKLHGKGDLEERESALAGPQDVVFRFPGAIPIPEAMGIDQAYIGIAQAEQLLNVLCNDKGEMRAGIFKENVRIYQGDSNPVNREIYATLASPERALFPFLNNGLTIIARKLNNAGGRFTISGYQVVNGGQTCHQLARWARAVRASLGTEAANAELSKVTVPVKLISTASSEIFSRVSVATNLQSAISDTDIQSSTRDAQNVELYFAQSGADGLRYSRQNGTEISELDVPALRIVTTSDLDRAVAACIFGESAKSIGSPKELYHRDSYVWGGHPVVIYYFSAWIVYRIESLFRRAGREDDVQYVKAAKYHIAMIAACHLIPELADVFSSSQEPEHKNISTAARAIEGSSWMDKVDDAVADAAGAVIAYFSASIKTQKALVKDEVRNKSVEIDLYNRAFSGTEE